MFWIFCIIVVLCVELEHIIANMRERWIVKNGYSYDPEKHCWVKVITNEVDK